MHHLTWGILGAGHIAHKFARGLATISDRATAYAIGSRSREKADAFAQQYSLPRAYGSYEEVLADPAVDIVYIALPNHLHAEWSIKAARAGKHILCEKPVTANLAELEEVLAVVKQHDVFFMEAFMYRCHPQWQKVREIIAAGLIGEVRMLQGVFAYNMGTGGDNFRLLKSAASGALMDVGCYCVSFARMIAQAEPIECHAVAHLGSTSQVDEQGTALLKFPHGIVAAITFAMECNVPDTAAIYGSQGSIILTSPWLPTDDNACVIVDAAGRQEYQVKAGIDLYVNEALHVAQYIDARQAPAMSWADSLGQARTLDALRASMGLHWEGE